jgi:hypothetical protein
MSYHDTGPRGNDNHFGLMQAAGHVIEFGKTGRQVSMGETRTRSQDI